MSTAPTDLDTPRFRSGVAARMARMPAATLRIWERRYGVVNPSRSEAGQRLYSRRDVQRLILIKALSERGHAIGAIATLAVIELESLMRDSAFTQVTVQLPDAVIAIGPGWTTPTDSQHAQQQWQQFASIDDARMATLPRPVDVLLMRVPSLHSDAATDVLKFADRCAARSVVVAYAFGSFAAMERLRSAGVRLYREIGQPVETTVLLAQALYAPEPGADTNLASWKRAPRRFNDEQLIAAAQASRVVACECPRHVADLIAQMSAFEDYSDHCASRSPDDAALHRYLGDISNAARQLFETALERLAEFEGMPLQSAMQGVR